MMTTARPGEMLAELNDKIEDVILNNGGLRFFDLPYLMALDFMRILDLSESEARSLAEELISMCKEDPSQFDGCGDDDQVDTRKNVVPAKLFMHEYIKRCIKSSFIREARDDEKFPFEAVCLLLSSALPKEMLNNANMKYVENVYNKMVVKRRWIDYWGNVWTAEKFVSFVKTFDCFKTQS